ncbi:MAG: Zn-dependent hydrolase [Chloroflexota bacterium]|jgi:N-carbamoyl-L-amino-acid hydrolase
MLKINPTQLQSDLDALNQFGHNAATGGMNRVAYNEADMQARRWFDAQMRELGLTVRIDAAGNSIGTYAGSQNLPPIALGSHTDTVPEGGKYDGTLGVTAALACVRALKEANIRLQHPIEVINFTAEEATMGGGTFGSLAMAIGLPTGYADKPAWDGRPVHAHLSAAGIDPAGTRAAKRAVGSVAAYFELHIEQGGNLIGEGKDIGIVEGIVGIRRYLLAFDGDANHAGTTPMHLRNDALVKAAPIIHAVRDLALKHGIVATIGSMSVKPGASNVIPGRVDVVAEMRSLKGSVLDAAERDLQSITESLGGSYARMSIKEEMICDEQLQQALVMACGELCLSRRYLPSGAGHDAMCMAAICPSVMLFVPSVGGISHSPKEFTSLEDCVNGANVMLGALLHIDAQLS